MVDDEELRRRLEVLRNQFDAGRIKIAPHLSNDFEKSFAAVRYGADGKIDLSTVDGRVRSMAMMAAMMKDRNDLKSAASISDIQNAFFQRISNMFQTTHDFMIKNGANPHSLSWQISRDKKQVSRIHPLIKEFVGELTEFWVAMSEPTRYHLQDLPTLKGVFGGDLFPSYERNIASTAGLYLDTIVLTDPFMNTQQMFDMWEPEEATRMFLKHGLQLMNYKKLVLSDVNPPIVVILPFESAYDESYRKSLFDASGQKALKHAHSLFGIDFAELDDFQEFVEKLKEPDDVVNRLTDPSRLLFDTDWVGNKSSQIVRAMKETPKSLNSSAGDIVFFQCFGRMSQATDISWKSQSLGGVPLVDAPTSWQYYNWSLEYDAETDSASNTPLHITRGMQKLADSDMTWLGNIPPEALIEIRQVGALEEIREIISDGVNKVVELRPDNFFRSADKIYDNIQSALSDHERKLDALRAKKLKFAGKDIGTWVVAGSIDVAAAILGTPAWGMASFAVSQLLDAPKITDIPKGIANLKKESIDLKRSAAGFLFKYRSQYL